MFLLTEKLFQNLLCSYFPLCLIVVDTLNDKNRRKFAGWAILFTCVGALLLTYAATNLRLPRLVVVIATCVLDFCLLRTL